MGRQVADNVRRHCESDSSAPAHSPRRYNFSVASQPTNRSRFQARIREQIDCVLHGRGRLWQGASQRERLYAIASAIHRLALDVMLECEQQYQKENAKRFYCLSMEFLMGRALGNNLHNLEIYDDAKAVIDDLGQGDLDELSNLEPDAGLGNGAIGRWAACLLDALATHHYPGFGYGINYEFGLFRQIFVNGYQHEKPDHWLAGGSPWMIERPDEVVTLPVYGSVRATTRDGVYMPLWLDYRVLLGVPHDMPIVGFGGRTVNVLRLFAARASEDFDIGIFNAGDYIAAVQQQISGEAISKILYPSDLVATGRELRFLQEYFLVACAVRDILRHYRQQHDSLNDLAQHVAIHINDADPALTIAELMRVLVDEERLTWEIAWNITTATCSHTNHNTITKLTHSWPVELIQRVLPRHLQIIVEIDRRLRIEIDQHLPSDDAAQRVAGIVEDGNVRMRHLAVVGSHGTIATSERSPDTGESVLRRLYPARFARILSGITPRRWLLHANRPLASLITNTIGDGWITDLERLQEFELFANDASVLTELTRIKAAHKLTNQSLTGATHYDSSGVQWRHSNRRPNALA